MLLVEHNSFSYSDIKAAIKAGITIVHLCEWASSQAGCIPAFQRQRDRR
jgi:hypothetical protein